MILIIDRLKEMNNFSDSEVKIAQYIIKNPTLVTTMSIHTLAKNTFSSAPTITRFCKKVGIDGFSNFKVNLAKEISVSNVGMIRIEDDLPFTKEDSPQDIAQNILNLNIQSMLDTYNHIDMAQIMRVSKTLLQAQSIMMYGVGQSMILCEDFQYKLLRIGIETHVASQIGFSAMQAFSQNKESVAVIISYYANNPLNLEIAKALKTQNIPITLITGPFKTPLSKYADEVIQVPRQEELERKMASYSSRSAIQLIIDILYASIFSLDYTKHREYIEGNA